MIPGCCADDGEQDALIVNPARAGMIPPTTSPPPTGRRKPRASGDDPNSVPDSRALTQVNPARAGMIPEETSHPSPATCKPRASGDDPTDLNIDAACQV